MLVWDLAAAVDVCKIVLGPTVRAPHEVPVSGLGFRVSGLGFRVSGFGFRVSGFGLRVSAFRFRDNRNGFGV